MAASGLTGRVVVGSNGEVSISSPTQTNTRLVYDYTAGSRGWKFMLDEIPLGVGETVPRFSRIVFRFEIGKYNVINSIVPREGYNWDFITPAAGNYTKMLQNMMNRFQGNQDWYPIMANPEYRDADDDFITTSASRSAST